MSDVMVSETEHRAQDMLATQGIDSLFINDLVGVKECVDKEDGWCLWKI